MLFSKSQAATEFMILIAAVLLLFLPMMFLLADYSARSGSGVNVAKMNEIGNKLTIEAREIYYLGLWSKEVIIVNLPIGVEKMSTLMIYDDKGNGDPSDDMEEYYIMINYLKEGDLIEMVIPSEVIIITDDCESALAASNCPSSVTTASATATCYNCSFNPGSYTEGRKDLKLETIHDINIGKIGVNISRSLI